ncbi:uncharacterized protein PAC_16856, partial [Phialocephala subalpina]
VLPASFLPCAQDTTTHSSIADTPYYACYKWAITDNSCIAPIVGCPNDNVCSECGIYGDALSGFGCSPAPNVHVNNIQVHGLWNYCRWDINHGACNSIFYTPTNENRKYNYGDGPAQVESCQTLSNKFQCRNDGKRNLDLGLINKREYEIIEATNAMLDIHKREYADALTWMSSSNITALRDTQIRELKHAEEHRLRARSA